MARSWGNSPNRCKCLLLSRRTSGRRTRPTMTPAAMRVLLYRPRLARMRRETANWTVLCNISRSLRVGARVGAGHGGGSNAFCPALANLCLCGGRGKQARSGSSACGGSKMSSASSEISVAAEAQADIPPAATAAAGAMMKARCG